MKSGVGGAPRALHTPVNNRADNAAVTTAAPILVADDEPATSDVVRAYLEREGFDVVVAADGQRALDVHRQSSPQLVILDVMLPERDGFEVAQEIRRRGSTVPILMLSARAEEVDRILGLRLGADDYLVKPFSPREVVARVHALLRRSRIAPEPPAMLRAGELLLAPDHHEATVSGTPVDLTHFEFMLLLALMETPGRVWTRQQLLARLYRETSRDVLERTVDVHVARIRDKLEQAGASSEIQTVRGVGYKLAVARAAADPG
jgi:DNA-binding response OmpR family regulator